MGSTSNQNRQADATKRSAEELLALIDELESRLSEAEETISSIRNGDVDALIITAHGREELYMLQGAERPYRLLVESMNEGALSLTEDGDIIFANAAFVRMVGAQSSGRLLGSKFRDLVAPADRQRFDANWAKALEARGMDELTLESGSRSLPVYFSYSSEIIDGQPIIFVVITDVSYAKQAQEEISGLNHQLRLEARELEARVAERTSALQASNEELEKKDQAIRQAYSDVIDAVTGGKLIIMTGDEIREMLGEPVSDPYVVNASSDVADARNYAKELLSAHLADNEVNHSLVILSEAVNNGIVYAGQTVFRLFRREAYVQIAVFDHGPGIDFSNLPKATLVTGFSSAGSLGLGFSIILSQSGRVMLATQPGETIVVMEVPAASRS